MIPAAILTDIEGTTSSIAFVHEVLFPYSRARLAGYGQYHAAELADLLDAVRAEAGAPLDVAGCIALLSQWHDEDRKIAPLKTLQGHVYADAVAGLNRWHAAGIALYVYSSGSVTAQRLLFGHSIAGDLNRLFSGNFDTAVGGKKEAASYRAIAAAIGTEPGRILFLSDVAEELTAAREADMAVTLLARGGLPSDRPPESPTWPVATSFDQIVTEVAA